MQYWFSRLILLWPDAPSDTVIENLQPDKGWGRKDFARVSVEGALFSAHVSGALGALPEIGLEWVAEKVLGDIKGSGSPSQSRSHRKPLAIAPADVFREALTGKPLPAELTHPEVAAALDRDLKAGDAQ